MILPPFLTLSHRRPDFKSLRGKSTGLVKIEKKCLIVAHKGFGQIKNWALGQSGDIYVSLPTLVKTSH